MEELKYSEMTNNELQVEQKKLEAEYEAIKSQILSLTARMAELDKCYNEVEQERNKRRVF